MKDSTDFIGIKLLNGLKSFCAGAILLIVLDGYSQVSPYTVSPDWYFGQGGRLTFVNGNFPVSGGPTSTVMPTNNSTGVENSTSICFNDRSVALYTNTMQAYNGNPANAAWTDFIRNFSTDGKCAGSSTGGAVAFPDPTSPTNAFYLIIANDLTLGGCANQGVTRYRFTGTGTSVVYNAGPTTIAPTTFASEAITVGTDGAGGYNVIIHDKSTSNTFRVWRYTPSGITGPTDYTVGAAIASTDGTQSYLKISPCQDKIAYHAGTQIVVHSFNRATGAVGAELRRHTIAPNYGVGLEFSPDGGTVYFSGQGSTINYFIISSGASGSVAGSASWSMQLGPDGKIYASPGGSVLGVLSTPNGGGATYSTISIGSASTFRGLTNLAWLTPEVPDINRSITNCTVDFTHQFRNYFQANVGVNTGTFSWNFGDTQTSTAVAPSHTYSTGGTYNVTLSFNDATCGHSWSASKSVTVSCPLPVEWLDFDATYNSGKVDLTWSTAKESDNKHFEIQRSSDGVTFETIGKLDTKGNGNSVKEYTFVDAKPLSGGNFYRIVQTDIDGRQSASEQAFVTADEVVISVSPNPSFSQFDIYASGISSASISITDMLGKVVYETELENMTTKSIGEDLSGGTYILKVMTAGSLYTEKLIKK